MRIKSLARRDLTSTTLPSYIASYHVAAVHKQICIALTQYTAADGVADDINGTGIVEDRHVAADGIIEHQRRVGIVHGFKIAADRIAGAEERRGRSYLDGGSILAELHIAIDCCAADGVICAARRDILDCQVPADLCGGAERVGPAVIDHHIAADRRVVEGEVTPDHADVPGDLPVEEDAVLAGRYGQIAAEGALVNPVAAISRDGSGLRHGNRNEAAKGKGVSADRDGGGHGIARRVDRRHATGAVVRDVEIRDIDLAAIRAHRHPVGVGADQDGGNHGIARRVDRRHTVGAVVRDVSVLRENLSAGEKTEHRGCNREQAANAKTHGNLLTYLRREERSEVRPRPLLIQVNY
jgi:hypothetical protein